MFKSANLLYPKSLSVSLSAYTPPAATHYLCHVKNGAHYFAADTKQQEGQGFASREVCGNLLCSFNKCLEMEWWVCKAVK